MSRKLHVREISPKGKRVLTRVDFNVPLTGTLEVADDTRIRRALPTIQNIVERGGRAVLMSHLGRPKGKVVEDLRMDPAAARLESLISREVALAPDCVGDSVEQLVAGMRDGDIALLGNLRFHEGESKNDADFSRRLARLGDVYVNDAFGTAHRAHASTVGVTEHIGERAMGFLMEQELTNLAMATESPQRPYAAILGGAKVSDKIGMMENLMTKVDSFLIGGAMAFTFLRAKGNEVGDSLLEEDKVDVAAHLLALAERHSVQLFLPIDVLVANTVAEGARAKTVGADELEGGWRGVDIGPRTATMFADVISKARTIVWNGPLGVFEVDAFAEGTRAVAEAVSDRTAKGAISIVGGGDTAAAVSRAGLAGGMTHISTGGGASLKYLEGKPLPAVEALSDAS